LTVEQAAAALSVSWDTFHAEIEPELKIVRLVVTTKRTQGQWGSYRKSYIRRGVPVPREVLISDLGGVSSELAKSQGDSYPGSSRQAWARWQAEQTRVARPQAPRTTTNAEEPLLERI
jgi:hypothetical protein